MNKFISEIKKIPTHEIITTLSYLSIKMLKSGKNHIPLNLVYKHYGFSKCVDIPLFAWDIPSIEFLSVQNSNDYRNSNKPHILEWLVNYYRVYDNNHSVSLKNADYNTILRTTIGMTSEQFAFQEFWRFFDKFNRDYHILLAAKEYKHRKNLEINAITQEIFGLVADDYIAVLLTVFWLCAQHPDPLEAPENLYRRNGTTILTKQNLTKFVSYYSCTYEELRTSTLGKQLLYSKPFIKTSKGIYLSSSLFLVAMIIGNGLYWITRDYYLKQNSRFFTNTFGLIFEDYIEELASKYCEKDIWKKIPEGEKKSADYIFDFGDLKMLIECKTSLLALDSKQQVPNVEKINKFFNQTIKESYEQLSSSYSKLSPSSKVPIMKVILLYDEFSNTGIIESSIPEIFDKDNLCYIMTIREFEILLYTHKYNSSKREELFNQIIKTENCEQKQAFGSILGNLSLHENHHINKELNYFSKLLDYFGYQLKNE